VSRQPWITISLRTDTMTQSRIPGRKPKAHYPFAFRCTLHPASPIAQEAVWRKRFESIGPAVTSAGSP
jgi:hypothetical protein